jgi:glycosyltransferase involved in cell wall biosynthesis
VASKYVGEKRGSVCLVSSSRIVSSDVNVVEVPTNLQDLSADDLITSYRVKRGSLRPRRAKVPASEMKVALVGNWKMQCGIATYSENLWPEVARRVKDYKLFIETNDAPTGPVNVLGGVEISNEKVVACWKRGEPLTGLVQAIIDYDPDVVWFQHEFGIWPHAGHWLSMMSQLSDHRVIVTMHSVFHHRDKTIVEASIPEVIVHLDGARKVLKEEKGIPGVVHVIPHGCHPASPERLWNFYKSDHTFLQWGFGFRYKGWELSIRAADILRKRYPDAFFTGLFSESPYNRVDHQVYYDELARLIDDLDLRKHVAIIRGYQSDASLDSYMRTNQAIVLPYVSHPDHEVFGVSGAARLAMSKMAPVITTSVNHFSDVPTLKADTPEQIADALGRMFSDNGAREHQVSRQLDYLRENTWSNVAERHVRLFETGQV